MNRSWNEAQANADMEAQAEQNRLNARQRAAKEANEAARQVRSDLSRIFWHRVMRFITTVTVLAVVYKLFIISGVGHVL